MSEQGRRITSESNHPNNLTPTGAILGKEVFVLLQSVCRYGNWKVGLNVMKLVELDRLHREGRDELNLADFPISALPRAQKNDGAGRKLDRMEFKATRYDSATRQRIQQKVTLTSTAHDGLPTPADEHVVLALLHAAKHTNNFEDDTVHFAPSQLFEIMGWAPNGRSYTRLRDVLRRLKALTIRYENAWWDIAGRAYEEEVATGIISAYRIARQVSGPRRPGQQLQSWVTWTQSFHQSLQAGNLKRLDLTIFFRLQTPTAQRIYRFLDKRFYTQPTVALDLVEFACGHIGLTEVENVAVLKRRLAPAIDELEKIGFIRPLGPSERYQKVTVGQWRIVFHAAGRESDSLPQPAVMPVPVAAPEAVVRTGSAEELAVEFYRQWDPAHPAQPGPRDLEQAELLLHERSLDEARELVTSLVQVTRKEWPECRSLSGAVQKYLPDVLKLREQQARRQTSQRQAEKMRAGNRQELRDQQEQADQLEQIWQQLSEEQRQAIEQQVRQRLGGHAPTAFVHRLCLEEVARQRVSGGS